MRRKRKRLFLGLVRWFYRWFGGLKLVDKFRKHISYFAEKYCQYLHAMHMYCLMQGTHLAKTTLSTDV